MARHEELREEAEVLVSERKAGPVPQQNELDVSLDELRRDLGEALSEGGSQPLLRLTDEELAVLDPAAAERSIVPAPHLEGMSAQEREWVLATALRSLVSRELVEVGNIGELDALVRQPPGESDALQDNGVDGDAVEVDMRVTPELDLALVLRRTADRVLAVEQNTAAGTAFAYVYVHTTDLLLIERVTSGGLHLFTLAASVRDAADVIRTLIDPFGVADRDGRSLKLDAGALEPEQVGQPFKGIIDSALVVGQLILLADTPGPLLMTYATGKELWMVSVDAPQAPTAVTARSVGQMTLTDSIARLLTPSA